MRDINDDEGKSQGEDISAITCQLSDLRTWRLLEGPTQSRASPLAAAIELRT